MDLVRVTLAVCLVLCLLANSIFASPVLRSDLSQESMSEADQMAALSEDLPNAFNSLSRQRRSFAQYHQGRQHYYNLNLRPNRRFERRFRSRRRHRLHHQGAGQIVYE